MSKSYKDTLNLPNTAFPMKANLAQREPQMLERWRALDLYALTRQARAGAERFILHDGPPYANGEIHIGHAVNKVLKDIIVKSKLLAGYDAPYVPGWDCHGLPIELNVEKQIGKAGEKVDVKTFRAECRRYAASQVERQKADFERLGVLGDWANPYLTMDHTFEANILRALARVIGNGHLHRGFKPVHWCVDCGSALAEAEVEYADKTSPAIDVRFRAVQQGTMAEICQATGEGDIAVVIWTTTPWTLPANHAVALHPDLEYVLVQTGNERLLLADALSTHALHRYGIEGAEVVGRCLGYQLEGQLLEHPFYERNVPIILGDHVTTDAGTGAVHTAPGHGEDDYIVGARYGLPVDNPVGDDGRFLPHTELLAGLNVLDADAEIVRLLDAKGALVHQEKIRHSYPHCWRHKTPIIFRATPQWFISMVQQGLRGRALDEIGRVRWLPEWGAARIRGMVEARPDWCISRQRNWGVPIALFVHRETGEPHPDTPALMEKVAQKVEQAGLGVWFEWDAAELVGQDMSDYVKVTDTLDVWFDSGVTHYCVLDQRPELHSPADLYLEGSDQHRGWFQSSLLASVAMRDRAPYRAVLTHGFTVDAEGRKMSKSLGNVVAPQAVMKKLGADILRLWVAATDYRAEMGVSDEILNRVADSYRRIRNTARFLLANLAGFDPAHDTLPPERMLPLDRWAVDRARRLQEAVVQAYTDYEFHLIYQKVHNFCAVDLGGFYLDIIKDRQYTTQADGLPRRSAQTALYHIVEAMTRWLAPILSFTGDEIWAHIPGERAPTVFVSTWYDRLDPLPADDPLGAAFWETVIAVRESVYRELERLRAAGAIGSGLEAEVDVYAPPALAAELERLGDELRFVLITSEARVQPLEARPEAAVRAELRIGGELWIGVRPSAQGKCVRCWHLRSDVGAHAEHPELCGRCVENVAGAGEVRRYA